MLLSRFWYVVLAVALGASIFNVFLATSMYDRASTRAMGQALAGDSQVVASYLRDDARKRATALLAAAFNEEIRSGLAKINAVSEKIPLEPKDKVKTALRKEYGALPADLKFDALFAVDQGGRVVAQVGFDQASGIENFELGGYPVVADALHGWVRDDSWVLAGRIYRVVARPVENEVGALPAGALVGARIIDDAFARELSRRTGAALGFYANGARVSSGAPEGFDTARLDTITTDIKGLDGDPTYKEKGVSDVRTLHSDLGVVYARITGEAWDLGAGYAVAKTAHLIGSPLGFLRGADDKDKASVAFWILPLVIVFGAGAGIAFTFAEHTRPLHVFRREALRFAKGEVDQLVPSRFRGVYRKIASDINDGNDKVAAKGGAPRKAADLEQVLGPMPAQPAMSAFSLPQDGSAAVPSGPVAPMSVGSPQPVRAPAVPPAPAQAAPPPPRPKGPPAGKSPSAAKVPTAVAQQRPYDNPLPVFGREFGDDDATIVNQLAGEVASAAGAGDDHSADDEAVEWRRAFEDYVRIKRECGETTEGITFEKFQNTLRKNRDQLVQRHACKTVKFSVYVKDGKAAIKANPVREG